MIYDDTLMIPIISPLGEARGDNVIAQETA